MIIFICFNDFMNQVFARQTYPTIFSPFQHSHDMYKYCYQVISKANPNKLRELFLREIKKRKNNTALLRKYPMSIRQMMLSLNLPEDKANKLLEQLNININQA